MKGTELLIISRPFIGELPAKITQALTLLACIRKVLGSNVGWHTHDLGSLCSFPQSPEARTGIANLICIRARVFLSKFLPIYSYTCRPVFQRCVV